MLSLAGVWDCFFVEVARALSSRRLVQCLKPWGWSQPVSCSILNYFYMNIFFCEEYIQKTVGRGMIRVIIYMIYISFFCIYIIYIYIYIYIAFSIGAIWCIIFLFFLLPSLALHERLFPKFYWSGPWVKVLPFKMGPRTEGMFIFWQFAKYCFFLFIISYLNI